MSTILGTDDSVNTCDCCGKSNLKFTFAVEVDGEVLHYGSVCVRKWTGRTAAQAGKEIEAREAAEKAVKESMYRATTEYAASAVKMAEAHRIGLIGRAFKEYCTEEFKAADAKRAEIFA